MASIDHPETGTTMLYCEGNKSSKIALIGEAPGSEEEKTGRPFVGASGELLNQLLRAVGLSRSNIYITNVVKERPPGNDISKFIEMNKKGKPSTEKYKRYVEILKEELSTCEANVFVPLGNVSLYALTGLTGVTNRRGSILSSTLLPGRKVISTIHPAAALREYIQTIMIQHDLMLIKSESEFPEIRNYYPNRTLLIAPSYEDCVGFIQKAKHSDWIAFDIETPRGNIGCISIATSRDESICIPLNGDAGGHYFSEEEELRIWLALADLLEAPTPRKVGHNTLFDSLFLFDKYGIRVNSMEDTMVMHRVLFPDLPARLAFLVSTCTKQPYYKDMARSELAEGQDK